jgi:hypothetical protein
MEKPIPIDDLEKRKKEGIKRTNQEFFGDVNVDGIIEAVYHKPDVIKVIENEILIKFERTYNILSKISWGEFCEQTRKYYKGSEQEVALENLIEQIEQDHIKKKEFHPESIEKLPIVQINAGYMLGSYFHNKKGDAVGIYEIGAFLKKDVLAEKDVLDDIKIQLKDKKILILGDDSGSFSEILNYFGANAIGIEYDQLKVLAAHSGIFSESKSPQMQVIGGDIFELTGSDSDLYKKINECGPFDIVYSRAVFNRGSGIEEAIEKYQQKNNITGRRNEINTDFGLSLTNNCIQLLKNNGFILHTNEDMNMFGPYSKRYIRESDSHEYGTSGSSMIFIPKEQYKGFVQQ